jgi:hypothetical protein
MTQSGGTDGVAGSCLCLWGVRMSYAVMTAFLIALVATSFAGAVFTGLEIAKLVTEMM